MLQTSVVLEEEEGKMVRGRVPWVWDFYKYFCKGSRWRKILCIVETIGLSPMVETMC
jgi:hypothetical protein